jgi:diguanylate cyclase (GGDEF)-like protein/PAS domain S-box-containing protein
LQTSEGLLRTLVEHLPDIGLFIFDADRRILTVGGQALSKGGFLPINLIGRSLGELISEESAAIFEPRYRAGLAGTESTFQHTASTGGIFRIQVIPLQPSDGEPQVLVVSQDQASLIAADTARQNAENAYRYAFDSAPVGVAHVSVDGNYIAVNDALCELLGRGRDELLRCGPAGVARPEDRDRIAADLVALRDQGLSRYRHERCYDRPGNSPIWIAVSSAPVRDASGDLVHFVAHYLDITATKLIEADLTAMVERDPLSGLANRRGFSRALSTLLDEQRPGSLLVVDLDHFKEVNDTVGHVAGDILLTTIGDALRRSVRATDTVARLGGDEFAILLLDTGVARARRVAANLLDAVRAVGQPAWSTAPVTASIGIADIDPSAAVEDLMLRADSALYEAKGMGRDCYAQARPPVEPVPGPRRF